jgi:hypothetical protein
MKLQVHLHSQISIDDPEYQTGEVVIMFVAKSNELQMILVSILEHIWMIIISTKTVLWMMK